MAADKDKDKVGRITEDDSKKAALANALKKLRRILARGRLCAWGMPVHR